MHSKQHVKYAIYALNKCSLGPRGPPVATFPNMQSLNKHKRARKGQAIHCSLLVDCILEACLQLYSRVKACGGGVQNLLLFPFRYVAEPSCYFNFSSEQSLSSRVQMFVSWCVSFELVSKSIFGDHLNESQIFAGRIHHSWCV